MKHNPAVIFWAVSIASAASYLVCAAFVAVAPEITSQLFGLVMHVDLSRLARHVTWPSFFGGILCFSLLMGILAGASARAYNRLLGTPR